MSSTRSTSRRFWSNQGAGAALTVLVMLGMLLASPIFVVLGGQSTAAQVGVEVTFERWLSGDRVGQHKVPPLTSVTMTITAIVSSQVENAALADYFPSDWTVVDANGGIVSIHDENYNKIEWNVGAIGDSVSRSYVVRSPQRTLPPTKYYFRCELTYSEGSAIGDDWRVIVADPSNVINNGSFVSDLSSWTPVITFGYLEWDSAGYANGGCAKYYTDLGRNNDVDAYLEQSIGTISSTDTVTLSLVWKKEYAGTTASKGQLLEVIIVKPDVTTATIWSESTVYQSSGWVSVSNLDVSTYFDQDGAYSIRLRGYVDGANATDAQAWLYYDEVVLDVTAAVPPPGKPVLVSPENNYQTSDNTPTFTWENGANATYHRLVIDNSPDFSDGDNIYDNANIYDNTCTIENELPPDNYWWHVAAGGSGIENWSENTRRIEIIPYVPPEWQLIETWTGTVSAPVAWQVIETWTGTVSAPAEWQLIESWTGTVSAPAQWQVIETWTGTISAPAAWQLIEMWTGTVEAPVVWRLIEAWTGTVQAPAEWQVIDTWTGTVSAPAAWSLIETWTGTVTAPAAWQLIETWTGTVSAPAEWQLVETWTGTVSAPVQWQLIETWTGTVSAPAEWQLIETWTGTVSAPAQWQLIETWTGTVSAPAEWQVIETWTGTVEASAEWQVVETWTGVISAPAEWDLIETWTGTVTALAPPGKPALISPGNATQTDNTSTFKWNAGDYADSHRLLVDNDLNFSTPNENRIIQMPENTYTIPPENSLPDDNYYWMVVAINELGENESDNWTFEVIAALLPGKPVLFAPENGTQTSNKTPTFEWVVGSNADNHRIEVDNEPTFSSLLVDNVVLGPLDNTWTAPGYAEGTYYWRVWAINEAGEDVSENTWVIEIIPPAWYSIETWTGMVQAPAQWQLIESWTGTVSAPAEWQMIETWTGTVSAPVQWQVVETWTGTVSAPAIWQVVESWTGTISAPAVWRLVETWTGTVQAPAEWQLVESWTGTVQAPVGWDLIETWTGAVQAPAEWRLIETWTGSVSAPAEWHRIETWTGTVQAPAEWQPIETWTGAVSAPVVWQLIESWTGTV